MRYVCLIWELMGHFRRHTDAPEMLTPGAFEPAQMACRIDGVSPFNIPAAAGRTVRDLAAVHHRGTHGGGCRLFGVHRGCMELGGA
jgi:hypothetical protein